MIVARFTQLDSRTQLRYLVAGFLFLVQFAYYQFQNQIGAAFMDLLPSWFWDIVPVNHPTSMAMLLHIFVHAAFSIVIVRFMYADKSHTVFVVWLSVFLLLLCSLVYGIRIFYPVKLLEIISINLLILISSPFKTIFSLPALKLKEAEHK